MFNGNLIAERLIKATKYNRVTWKSYERYDLFDDDEGFSCEFGVVTYIVVTNSIIPKLMVCDISSNKNPIRLELPWGISFKLASSVRKSAKLNRERERALAKKEETSRQNKMFNKALENSLYLERWTSGDGYDND